MDDSQSRELENTEIELESLKENQDKSWGGPRAGAGRPQHSKNRETKEREEALRGFKARVTKSADRLFNAQMNLAEGITMLFRIEKDEKGNNKKPEIVTDEETITRFIDECGGYEGVMDGDTYYFLTTKVPDNRAIDSMLDRTFGKAKEKVDITSGDRPLQQPVIISTVAPRNATPETEAAAGN
jgi:hypothetical protein